MKTNVLKMSKVHHHNEAFECLETDTKWFKWKRNTDPIQLIYLRKLWDMAALKKKKPSLEQATIKTFLLKL